MAFGEIKLVYVYLNFRVEALSSPRLDLSLIYIINGNNNLTNQITNIWPIINNAIVGFN